jgi:hypothetical protein
MTQTENTMDFATRLNVIKVLHETQSVSAQSWGEFIAAVEAEICRLTTERDGLKEAWKIEYDAHILAREEVETWKIAAGKQSEWIKANAVIIAIGKRSGDTVFQVMDQPSSKLVNKEAVEIIQSLRTEIVPRLDRETGEILSCDLDKMENIFPAVIKIDMKDAETWKAVAKRLVEFIENDETDCALCEHKDLPSCHVGNCPIIDEEYIFNRFNAPKE